MRPALMLPIAILLLQSAPAMAALGGDQWPNDADEGREAGWQRASTLEIEQGEHGGTLHRVVPEDAQTAALFVRLEVTGARCVEMSFSANLEPAGAAVVSALTFGTTEDRLDVQEVRQDGRSDDWLFRAVALSTNYPGQDQHERVQAEVVDHSIVIHSRVQGHEALPEGKTVFWVLGCLDEALNGSYWLYAVSPHRLDNTSLELRAYERYDWENETGMAGSSRLSVVSTSESKAVLFVALHEMRGPFSMSRNIEGFGMASAGAVLSVDYQTTRGFAGGVWGFEGGITTYSGPGVVGVGNVHVSGGAGHWTFQTPAYAAPHEASHFVWGADIDTLPRDDKRTAAKHGEEPSL